ncbi:hypothetical protein B0T22DRAFT_271342 [Podospora appendiculata]|uniref:Uncharacterized protein n=1 Tax=Podospora appendiculata TaxID=314037 RepID=A0AAE0X3Y4_9PEZI|nr:hypothetical protein B0T22DRAFT_271342 [Podospora appendiculata]
MANRAGLDHDAYWHTIVGWILYSGEYYNEAATHFTSAVHENPKSWLALDGLAQCAAAREDWEHAILWEERSIHTLPPELYKKSADLWRWIARWASNDPNLSHKTLTAAEEGFKANRYDSDVTIDYLVELRKHGDVAKLMQALNDLSKEKTTPGYSLLLCLFLQTADRNRYNLDFTISNALTDRRWTDNTEQLRGLRLILDALEEALKIAKAQDRQEAELVVRSSLGYFKLHSWDRATRDEGAVELETYLHCRAAFHAPLGFRQQQQHTQIRARVYLSHFYFTRVMGAQGQNAETQAASAQKLKTIADKVMNERQEHLF